MAKTPSRKERLTDAFFVLGSQYYTLARYCSEEFYLPVSVTLFHHAIEMLLKGFLIYQGKTLSELMNVGHDLEKLWGLFKTVTSDDKYSRYDPVILRLNQVESLRYPNMMVDKGFVLNVRLGTHIPLDFPGQTNAPRFDINVWALDEIVTLIFKGCNYPPDPYFRSAPSDLKNALPIALRPKD